jgi:hypothetical protein
MSHHPLLLILFALCGASLLAGCEDGSLIGSKGDTTPSEQLQVELEKKQAAPGAVRDHAATYVTSSPSAAGGRKATGPEKKEDDGTEREDELVPFGGRVGEGAATPTACELPGFAAQSSFKLFAAGAYSGRDLDYQIDQSGNQATRIDVAVNYPAEPVVLMLGAYEPTVWNIGWSKQTRIAAVLVSGYHRQAVAGLPKEVPVLVSTYDNKGPCGYFYVSQGQIGRLNPVAVTVFGKKVDMVYLAKAGHVLIGDAMPPSALVTSSRITPDSFREADAPLAGEAGLRDAVTRGLLREARREDMDAWALVRASVVASADLPPIAGQTAPSRSGDGFFHNGYVVLKPMKIPAGLYGAHSATFFVPKGVPRPTGNLGHSKMYDFNTATCVGLTCRGE